MGSHGTHGGVVGVIDGRLGVPHLHRKVAEGAIDAVQLIAVQRQRLKILRVAVAKR